VILFKQCEVFAPKALGVKDVLIAGGEVAAIADSIRPAEGVETKIIDGSGLKMIPGLVDLHAHLSGGGGEGGPATRTPAPTLSQFLEAGITTVVGCLGTDGFTRSLEDLLMRAKALRAEGIHGCIYCGAYQVPTPTLLGDVAKDIALIEEVVGAGEIAIADHRSSGPTVDDIIRLGHHARVGGMVGGKAGILHLHMGDGHKPFDLIYRAVEYSELPLKQFLPTHCNRNHEIFEDSKSYGKQGYVDFTAGTYDIYPDQEIKPSTGVRRLVEAGVPLAHITISSDTGGSLPSFDKEGNLIGLSVGVAKPMFQELIDMVRQETLSWEDALRVVTTNPADRMKLPRKGRVKVGLDADVALLDEQDRIVHLVARGKMMIESGKMLRKGTFES
jgi:beta-aspartyl-dipeptidase (metallo-type)